MADWKVAQFSPEHAGWIPPEDRDLDMRKADRAIMADMPDVDEVWTGSSASNGRPRIWQVVGEAIKQGLIPEHLIWNKKWLKNISQITGSCVGFGAGNMDAYQSVIDRMVRGQRELITIPFVPYHYGRGRLHSGIRGQGSGSFGSGQAKALAVDGVLQWDHEGLGLPAPDFKTRKGIIWTSGIELQWSDGARIDQRYIEAGKKHLYPTAARVTNLDQAQTLLDSYYTFTIASNWGGLDRCEVRDGVLLSRHAQRWNHQMSVLDYITHPRLGRLWWVCNQWQYVMDHGTDPGGEWDGGYGAPPGGFYIADKDLSYIINQNETFAFADKQGFQDRSQRFKWIVAT